MIGLSFDPLRSLPDIFSRSCVEAFDACDWSRLGYSFTQLFEPAVLREISLLEAVPHSTLARLENPETDSTIRLTEMLHDLSVWSVVELVNLASALVSVSRFDLARRPIATAAARRVTSREAFEIAWLEFLVSNRCDDGAGSPVAFEKMREAVVEQCVPSSRILDACTQAVVWYIKRREVSTAEFKHWAALGTRLAGSAGQVDAGALSSWYRGVAMIPAAKGNADATRRYMEQARREAQVAIAENTHPAALNALKTYYESALKEYLYVRRDIAAAEEVADALIELDPSWSISYGEIAEVFLRSGRAEQAAEKYEQAAAAGPPYVAHHLFKAASIREKAGDLGRALAHYETLAGLTPKSARVLSSGLKLARRMSHPSVVAFERGLQQVSSVESD